GLLGVDLRWDQCQQFRLERIQLVQTRRDISQLLGERVDPVERVKEGSQRPADRDVETVRLPIEIVAQRPEEVVEIGDLVAQVLRYFDGLVKRFNLVVRGGGALLLQAILLPQNADRLVDLGDLFEQVGSAVLLVFEVFDLPSALRTDLKRDRRVVQWGSQRAGDGLHLVDAGRVEDGLGHSLQQDHVGWIPQITIGLDHQQFGIELGLREV